MPTADPFSLNLRHLRALLIVQERGSISAGARAANLSQSALTQGIRKIENQLSCELFERQADGVVATPHGELALRRIAAALNHIDEAVRKLGPNHERSGRLITLTHVRALISLADARTFASAASATQLSQTSVHRAVGDLEHLIDERLVDRRGQGSLLSFKGRQLARGFRLAGRELRAMIGELSHDNRHMVPIAIGALAVARPFIVPTAIARMAGENPHARFTVAEGDWQDLVEQLQDGVIDLIIGSLRDLKPADLTQETLADDQVLVLCGRHHPLASDTDVSLADLARYPWIVAPPLSPLRQLWEQMFAGQALPDGPVECESIMVAINLLAQSHFLTLASPRQVELPLQANRLAQVGSSIKTPNRPIGMITRKNWRPTETEQRFIHLVAEAARHSGAAPIAQAQ